MDEERDKLVVAALMQAVRAGKRVKLSRGDDKVALVIPQEEYDELVAAAGERWVSTQQFTASYRGWRDQILDADLPDTHEFLIDVRRRQRGDRS